MIHRKVSFCFISFYVFGADFRPMAQDNHILFSQVFETVLKPLPKYDVDIVCRDSPSVKRKLGIYTEST